MWSICPNREDCFTNIPLPQLNNRMCVSWPYSQPSVVLLMCIPNFDKAIIRVLYCLSIHMAEIILLFLKNGLHPPKLVRPQTQWSILFLWWRQAVMFAFQMFWLHAYRMLTVIMTFSVLWHFLITRKLYQSKTYNHITILSIHLRVGKRVCG